MYPIVIALSIFEHPDIELKNTEPGKAIVLNKKTNQLETIEIPLQMALNKDKQSLHDFIDAFYERLESDNADLSIPNS